MHTTRDSYRGLTHVLKQLQRNYERMEHACIRQSDLEDRDAERKTSEFSQQLHGTRS